MSTCLPRSMQFIAARASQQGLDRGGRALDQDTIAVAHIPALQVKRFPHNTVEPMDSVSISKRPSTDCPPAAATKEKNDVALESADLCCGSSKVDHMVTEFLHQTVNTMAMLDQ